MEPSSFSGLGPSRHLRNQQLDITHKIYKTKEGTLMFLFFSNNMSMICLSMQGGGSFSDPVVLDAFHISCFLQEISVPSCIQSEKIPRYHDRCSILSKSNGDRVASGLRFSPANLVVWVLVQRWIWLQWQSVTDL